MKKKSNIAIHNKNLAAKKAADIAEKNWISDSQENVSFQRFLSRIEQPAARMETT